MSTPSHPAGSFPTPVPSRSAGRRPRHGLTAALTMPAVAATLLLAAPVDPAVEDSGPAPATRPVAAGPAPVSTSTRPAAETPALPLAPLAAVSGRGMRRNQMPRKSTPGFRFLGGVPRLVVPDNLKSGVHKASFYDPELNRSYGMMAEHYGIGVLPARPRKPRDKAKVEAGVRFDDSSTQGKVRRLPTPPPPTHL